LAVLELRRGERDRYRQACARMVDRFARSGNVNAAYWLTWCCVLLPDAIADWQAPLQLAEKAHAHNAKNFDMISQYPRALYPARRIEEALQRFTEAEAAHKQNADTLNPVEYNWFFLAMAHHRLDNHAEAASWLKKAVRAIDEPPPASALNPNTKKWNRRLT